MAKPGKEKNNETHESEGDIALEEAVPLAQDQVKEPGRYAVFLHNDNYSTMEFVVEVLTRFFKKTEQEATQVMLDVHKKGKGIAGIYSHEIAETKVLQVTEHARSKGFPLKCSAEKM